MRETRGVALQERPELVSPLAHPDLQALDESFDLRFAASFESVSPLIGQAVVASVELPTSYEILPEHTHIHADLIPELHDARQQSWARGEAILAARREVRDNGDWDNVVLDVDAVGTARKVLELERRFGRNSPEARQGWLGLVEDCDRLYGEARSGNVKEYFAPRRQDYIPGKGFYSHGHSSRDLLENGISALAHVEEQGNRIAELVEGDTYESIMTLPYADDISVTTHSECADFAIEEFKVRPNGDFAGYVPRHKKLVMRNAWFNTAESCMYSNQMWVSGEWLTHEVIILDLQKKQLIPEGTTLTKTEVRGTQVIGPNKGELQLIEHMRSLDETLGEVYGRPFFCAEPLQPGEAADYESIIPEAKLRQAARDGEGEELAHFIMGLARKDVDPMLAKVQVARHVKDKMLDAAKANPDLAAAIFDEKTAQNCYEARNLYIQGRFKEANDKWLEIDATAPDPSYCGGGSTCGIEGVEEGSEDAKWAKENLGWKPGDNIDRDKVRECIECGQKTIIYVWNKDRVNKGCINPNCNARQVTGLVKNPKLGKDKK